MDIVSQLLVAAFFSLHQYIPVNSVEPKYFDTSVDPVTLERSAKGLVVLAAANSSCRHFFKSGGEELDFTPEQLRNFMLSLIDQESENLTEVGAPPEQVALTLSRICADSFDPQAFTAAEVAAVDAFIAEQVNVLKKGDLDSNGAYKYFGAVTLFDRNGVDMGPLFKLTESWIPFSEIAFPMSQALIAAEDENFYGHDGVYLGSLIRMALDMKKSSGDSSTRELTGGSTITMQLLKNLYFNSWSNSSEVQQKSELRTLLRKVREWYWAKPFEEYHEKLGSGSGKLYVLEAYLNLMDFGPGVRGIDQAADVFFAKQPHELTIGDAAFLASLFKGPGIYARPRNYERFTIRRKAYVLNQMLKLTSAKNALPPITQAQFAEAEAQVLPQWNPPVSDEGEESAAYLRAYARDFLAKEVTLPPGERLIEPQLTSTIDSGLQQIVFDTVRSHLDEKDQRQEVTSRIGPARDDRSRVATPTVDDLTNDMKSALASLQESFEKLHLNAHLAVFLGDSGNRGNAQPQFYRHIKNGEPISQEVEFELNSLIRSQGSFVGQLFVLETSPGRCPLLSTASVSGAYENLESVLLALPETPAGALESDSSIDPDLPSLPEVNETLGVTDLVPSLPVGTSVLAPTTVPHPRPRPENADELIAEAKRLREENRFSMLPMEVRPAVDVPRLPETSGCVRLLNEDELRRLALFQSMKNVEETVSKRLVRQFSLRMAANAPRAQMLPAIYDGRQGSSHLVVVPKSPPDEAETPYSEWVRAARISKNSGIVNQAISRGETRVGQVYWVSSTDDISFKLEAPKIQSAVLVMNSETGEVLANFGGYLPRTAEFFDRSRIAGRPAGSTLKPWLYYLALNKGFEPTSAIQNAGAQFVIDDKNVYRPSNFSSEGGAAYVSFEAAFISSLNKPALGLLSNPQFGPVPMDNLREFIGVLTDVHIYDPATVQIVPSTALGAQDVKIIDLVSSFTFFANGESVRKPRFFSELYSGQGEQVYQGQPQSVAVPHSDNKLALFQMQNLLIKVANNGTARKLRDFPTSRLGLQNCDGSSVGVSGQICFGGKTGTSNDNKDNWFVGFSRNFVIGVWVGYDFPESTQATGGEIALPIFMDIIEKGRDRLPPIEPILSSIPEGLNLIYVNENQNCIAQPGRGQYIYSKSDGSNLPACVYRTCRCDAILYGGNDYDYNLIINGSPYQQFATTDDGSNDRLSCLEEARRWDCPL